MKISHVKNLRTHTYMYTHMHSLTTKSYLREIFRMAIFNVQTTCMVHV